MPDRAPTNDVIDMFARKKEIEKRKIIEHFMEQNLEFEMSVLSILQITDEGREKFVQEISEILEKDSNAFGLFRHKIKQQEISMANRGEPYEQVRECLNLLTKLYNIYNHWLDNRDKIVEQKGSAVVLKPDPDIWKRKR